ncbi:MAG: glutathione S-transferase C-terminal domain-containing protein, partial [Pseudomonadales bacterium]
RFPHPPLLPVYPVARAQARLWMQRIEHDWCPAVDRLMLGKGSADDAKVLGQSLTGIAPIFGEMPFFMSEEFTLTDCCLAPILWRLNQMGVSIPKSRQTKPLYEYMARLFTRDSFKESLSIQEKEMASPV